MKTQKFLMAAFLFLVSFHCWSAEDPFKARFDKVAKSIEGQLKGDRHQVKAVKYLRTESFLTATGTGRRVIFQVEMEIHRAIEVLVNFQVDKTEFKDLTIRNRACDTAQKTMAMGPSMEGKWAMTDAFFRELTEQVERMERETAKVAEKTTGEEARAGATVAGIASLEGNLNRIELLQALELIKNETLNGRPLFPNFEEELSLGLRIMDAAGIDARKKILTDALNAVEEAMVKITKDASRIPDPFERGQAKKVLKPLSQLALKISLALEGMNRHLEFVNAVRGREGKSIAELESTRVQERLEHARQALKSLGLVDSMIKSHSEGIDLHTVRKSFHEALVKIYDNLRQLRGINEGFQQFENRQRFALHLQNENIFEMEAKMGELAISNGPTKNLEIMERINLLGNEVVSRSLQLQVELEAKMTKVPGNELTLGEREIANLMEIKELLGKHVEVAERLKLEAFFKSRGR